MLRPNIGTAVTSYARASSVGAVYWPSGHHDWSRKPARKVKLPLSSGRFPLGPSPRANVRSPKYDVTASVGVLTLRSYRYGSDGDHAVARATKMLTSLPAAPAASATVVPSLSTTSNRTGVVAPPPSTKAVTLTLVVDAWSILSVEMYDWGTASIQTVCQIPDDGV